MKVSTLRKLLIALDLALVVSIGSVVWRGLEDKRSAQRKFDDFRQDIVQDLLKTRSEAAARGGRAEYGKNIMNATLAGRKDEPVAKAPEPVVHESVKTPLKDLVQVVGVVRGSRETDPLSVAYLTKKGTPITADLSGVAFYSVGEMVEFAPGAMIKRIEELKLPNEVARLQVIFDYDGKEVSIVAEPPPGSAAGFPGGGDGRSGARSSFASVQVTDDPGGWMAPTADPRVINVTPTGVRSIGEKGESVLEGVRFSTELLEDGLPAVRLDFIPPGNVLERGGAQSADLLESINGTRVSSKADVVNYVKANPSLTRFTVRIRRKGAIITRVVTVPRSP